MTYVKNDHCRPMMLACFQSPPTDHTPLSKYPYELTLGSYGEIADGAERISAQCIGHAGYPPDIRTSAGQIFHSNNWNVIVQDDNC
jgi:hypothetical protein